MRLQEASCMVRTNQNGEATRKTWRSNRDAPAFQGLPLNVAKNHRGDYTDCSEALDIARRPQDRTVVERR